VSAPFAALTGVTLGYSGDPVLSDVTLDIPAGGFTALVGPNGAGKTTFLRALLRRLTPRAGSVTLDGSKRLSYVPQLDAMNMHWPLTVGEAVSLALQARRPFGRLGAGEREAVAQALTLAGLDGVADRPLRAVSGGQRQRAVLAQALAQRPDALLLDEPTKGLDVAAEGQFLDLLKRLKDERGLTILFVTHALPTALNHASQILLFHQGRVVATTPEALVETRVLEDVYGTPFVHAERDGLRFVAPAGRPR
jgi:ABC-type Mn2+/Zn2+ transport system ATPase subunit